MIVNGALIENSDMMGNWQPDVIDRGPDGRSSPILKWIVPARVEGAWSWALRFGEQERAYDVLLSQQFQRIEGHARAGNRRESLTEARLRGEEIAFDLEMTIEGVGRVKHRFGGRVDGGPDQGGGDGGRRRRSAAAVALERAAR